MDMNKDKIRAKIQELRKELGKEMQNDFDRFLPLDEMLLRYEKGKEWDKASILNLGEGSVVHENSYIYGKPKIGKDVWIGPLTLIDGSGGLEIGDNSDISSGVQIYTHSTHMRILSDGKQGNVLNPVKIENNVFIGACAVILSGITIGHHSLVAAGAVITKDVPAKTIVAGVPARKIGEVEIDEEGNVNLRYEGDE